MGQDSLGAVPLFPLPNVVLFPRALVPLHIFEPRYRQMTADALIDDQQIAMALLREDEDADPELPAIHPVVCVGRIARHERLADGRYNLLLEGVTRASVEFETPPESSGKPYRIGHLTPLREVHTMNIDLESQRRRIISLLRDPALDQVAPVPQFRELIDGFLSTADLADLLACHMIEDVSFKQELLENADAADRIDRLIAALSRTWRPQPPPASSGLDPTLN